MSAGPDVSVVIPTRDRRDLLLAHGLRSARSQAGVAIEILVLDDGSTDGTATAVESLQDPRVRVLRSPRSEGVARARNRGLAEAAGRYVAFLDDDDLWAPQKLARHVEAMDAQHAGLSYGATLWLDRRRRVRADYPPVDPTGVRRALIDHNAIGTPSNVVLSTELAREAGGFEPALSVFADWDLWLRTVPLTEVAVVRESLVAYYVHGASMHVAMSSHETETRALRERHAALQEQMGVKLGGRHHQEWLVGAHLQAGRRVSATRAQLVLAREHGGWRERAEALRLLAGRTAFAGYLRRRPTVLDPRPVLPTPDWLAALLRGSGQ